MVSRKTFIKLCLIRSSLINKTGTSNHMPVQWVAIRSLNVTSSHVQFKIFMSWLKNLRKIMFWISISNIKNIQLKIYQIRVFFFWGWVLLKSHPLCESRFQPGTIKIRITIASQTTLLSTHLSQSVANTTNLLDHISFLVINWWQPLLRLGYH